MHECGSSVDRPTDPVANRLTLYEKILLLTDAWMTPQTTRRCTAPTSNTDTGAGGAPRPLRSVEPSRSPYRTPCEPAGGSTHAILSAWPREHLKSANQQLGSRALHEQNVNGVNMQSQTEHQGDVDGVNTGSPSSTQGSVNGVNTGATSTPRAMVTV